MFITAGPLFFSDMTVPKQWGKNLGSWGKISVRGEKNLCSWGKKSRFVGEKSKKINNCYRFGFGLPTETK